MRFKGGPHRSIVLVGTLLGLVLGGVLLLRFQKGGASGASLEVGNLRFVEYDGGRPQEAPYQPGDEVILNFQVDHLTRGADGTGTAKASFQAFDPSQRPLAPPVSSQWQGHEPLSASFHMTLPLYAVGGEHTLHVEVEDALSSRKVEGRVRFLVVAPPIDSSALLGLAHHGFLDRDRGDPIPEAVYQAGMKIRTRFHVVGFRLGPQNRVNLKVDLTVLDASGDVLLNQPGVVALDQALYYPALYLPVSTVIGTPEDMPSGAYRIKYTLYDGVAGASAVVEEGFRIR